MWSRNFCCCRICGTTKRKHYGNGLCYRCYSRSKYNENPEPAKSRARRYYNANKDAAILRAKKYYRENKDSILKKHKEYREQIYFDGMRERILIRDDYKCAQCGNAAEVVHHIDGSGRAENRNNLEDNLISLCRACHQIAHKPRLGTGKQG